MSEELSPAMKALAEIAAAERAHILSWDQRSVDREIAARRRVAASVAEHSNDNVVTLSRRKAI